jgi:hypothetical protein
MVFTRATGITTSVVESMEMSLKKDVLRELRAGHGRLLLHDEVEERPGQFEIVPLWESVEEGEIMTPRDVFEQMNAEGYKVCPPSACSSHLTIPLTRVIDRL